MMQPISISLLDPLWVYIWSQRGVFLSESTKLQNSRGYANVSSHWIVSHDHKAHSCISSFKACNWWLSFFFIISCLLVAHFSNMFPRQHSTFIGSVQPHYANWHSVMCQTHVIIELCMQPSHVYPPTHLILCVWGAIYSRVWAVIIRNMPAEFPPCMSFPPLLASVQVRCVNAVTCPR